MGDDTIALWRQIAESRDGLLRIPIDEHLHGRAEENVKGRGFLLASIRDIGCEFWGEVNIQFLDDGLALAVKNRKAEFRGLNSGEADDATMTYGSESIALIHKGILQGLPLSIDLSF